MAEGRAACEEVVPDPELVERPREEGYGRVRMRVIPACKRKALEDFITDTCEPGSVIHTDGPKEYDNLPNIGFEHPRHRRLADE